MSHMLKEYRGKIKLVYIDPPFDSKADYKKKIKIKNRAILMMQQCLKKNNMVIFGQMMNIYNLCMRGL